METWRNGVATAGKKQKKEEKKLTEENKHPVSANQESYGGPSYKESCRWLGLYIYIDL